MKRLIRPMMFLLVLFVLGGAAAAESATGPESETDRIWNGFEPEPETLQQFRIPVPAGWSVQKSYVQDQMRCADPEGRFVFQVSVNRIEGVFFAGETCGELYQELLDQLGVEMYRPVEMSDGEMGLFFPDVMTAEDGTVYSDRRLRLAYGRGNQLLMLDFISDARALDPQELESLVTGVSYVPAENEAVFADFALTVTAEKDQTTVCGGEKLRLYADFANPEHVNAAKKNNGITWYAATQTEGAEKFLSVSEDGVLSVSSDLAEPVRIAVIAVSSFSGTESWLELDAVPRAQSLHAEPEQIELWLGMQETAEIQVSAVPDTARPELEWSTANRKTAGVEPGEDGKALVRAGVPGTVEIRVRDLKSGIRTAVSVKVMQPVTGLEITGPSSVKRGANGYYHAKISPSDASDRRVEWSIDTESSGIAEIYRDGRLAVSGGAAPGTVITVYCRAPGGRDLPAAEYRVTVSE